MTTKEAAWDAFRAADWAGARDGFAAALEAEPGDPEALDGLGRALWWLGERDAGIERRREAYAAYRRGGAGGAPPGVAGPPGRGAGAGGGVPAAGIAVYLAGEQRIDGREAEAAGWLARARRLLEGTGPSPERGW